MEFVEILKKIEERLGYEIVALVHPDGSGSIFRTMSKYTTDDIIETFHSLEEFEALINKIEISCMNCDADFSPFPDGRRFCCDHCESESKGELCAEPCQFCEDNRID